MILYGLNIQSIEPGLHYAEQDIVRRAFVTVRLQSLDRIKGVAGAECKILAKISASERARAGRPQFFGERELGNFEFLASERASSPARSQARSRSPLTLVQTRSRHQARSRSPARELIFNKDLISINKFLLKLK